ncbi:hypothetical protein ACJX0J_020321, partial [Zea mays]
CFPSEQITKQKNSTRYEKRKAIKKETGSTASKMNKRSIPINLSPRDPQIEPVNVTAPTAMAYTDKPSTFYLSEVVPPLNAFKCNASFNEVQEQAAKFTIP